MGNLNGNVRLLGWFSDQNSGGTISGSGTPNTIAMFTAANTIGDSKITQNAAGSTMAFAPVAATSGAASTFTFTVPDNTGRTASAEVNSINYVMGTQTWATGALATQRGFLITGATLAFVGASTITDAYSFYVTAPTVGTNATITNNYSAGFNGRVMIAQGTTDIKIGERSAGNACIWFGQTTPGASNFGVGGSSTGATILNGAGTLGSVDIRSLGSNMFVLRGTATSGTTISFDLIGLSRTGQTASTEIPTFKVTPATIQWATGAITIQREHWLRTNTYSFVGASVITDAYGLYAEAPVAGTNATITNNYAIGALGRVRIVEGTSDTRIGLHSASVSAIWLQKTTTSTTNYSILADASTTKLNGVANLGLSVSNVDLLRIDGTNTSGAFAGFTYSAASNTGQTASTEISGYLYNSYSRQWATGAITNQRERWIKTVTYAFVGASVITNAFGFYVEAPTAGTNATITNNYAAGFSGNLALITAGNKLFIKEGTGGSLGQTTLVAGTISITISGVTTATRAFITLVTPTGTTLTTTYQAVCTANTLTIQANVAAGTINTADTSVLNYVVIQPTP